MEDKNLFKKSVEEIGSLNSLITVMQHYGVNFKRDNSGFYTNCMFHNDKNPSMRLTQKGSKALYNCFGCGAMGDIVNFICEMEKIDNVKALKKAYEILGVETKYKVNLNKDNKLNSFINFIKRNNCTFTKNNEAYNLDEIYIYNDENSKPIYCKCKYKNKYNKKQYITKTLMETEKGYKYGDTVDFDKCKKVIYNLSQVKFDIKKDNWIFFVEGEKDVESLRKLNLTATTIYTKKWEDSYSKDLENAKVALIGDSGKAGEEFKNFVTQKLKLCCKSLKVLTLPGIEKIGDGKNKDITDWLETGKTKEDLMTVLKNSLDILDKNNLQQDENGLYKVDENKKIYLTNFQIIGGNYYINKDNYDENIELNILSNKKIKSIIKGNSSNIFSDVVEFRKHLSMENIFYGDMKDLVKVQEHILNYLITKKVAIYNESGIKNMDNEYVLTTNKGTLNNKGEFDGNKRSLDLFNDIDFKNIKNLSKSEGNELLYYLFDFSSRTKVYNILGMAVCNMLNYFSYKSELPSIPLLQIIGNENISTILKFLFNDTKKNIALYNTNELLLLKVFNESYLPLILKDKDIVNLSNQDYLINHIYNMIENYESIYEIDGKLNRFTYRRPLILIRKEEIQNEYIKGKSNIIHLDEFNYNQNKAMDFLIHSIKGEDYLRKFSKSLYVYILNNFDEESFEMEYLIVKNTYNFEKELQNDDALNTAIYTMMGLHIIYYTFEEMGINTHGIIDLKEASYMIMENINKNMLK